MMPDLNSNLVQEITSFLKENKIRKSKNLIQNIINTQFHLTKELHRLGEKRLATVEEAVKFLEITPMSKGVDL